ncbi:TnsA endonuclease N-terminal domain-containing protein [Chitinibacter tainanensis]|uniref:TnsA endonuclease N-terminal domain-containing protein n=1 Tax=Chitinibacter tainanensis TaxID=230667 RepID=UPI0006874B98|nr:TnsA endonuclease N-terminal domain-containing protein [Chitinibacter tainanensis]
MINTTFQESLLKTLMGQVEEAFAEKPDLAGVVHGRRRITQGARGKRTALFPSRKNGMTIALESQLELAFCVACERNPNVSVYRCQALELELGHGTRYFPDFLIRTADEQWLVREVKPDKKLLPDEVQKRHALIKNILNSNGFDFDVIDQTDLPGRVEFENLSFLYQRSINKEWTSLEEELAIQLISKLDAPVQLGDLYAKFKMGGLSPLLADHLLFHCVFQANLNRPLRLTTLVGMKP